MKRILSLLLIACLSIGILGVAPVSAANDVVLMGTPIIDGQLDDMYKESLTLVFGDDPEANAFAEQWDWYDAYATVYALYDDQFVYLCAVVVDDDVVQPDDSHYDKWNGNGWDGVEFRLNFSNCDDTSKHFKVGVDSHTALRHD